ncbi:MAG: YdcF family protein [Candidatus Saccharibacteria bacterium]|nr:YdcF family protein [Candidatus Saccharibacteria bacterium]
MIHRLVGAVIIMAVMVVGLSLYLSPDGLTDCQNGPTTGQCAAADAIVVISGGDTNARTDEAIRLFQQQWAPLLIVSGAAADKSSQSNAAAMRQRANAQGVPLTQIIAEERSETTKQNAQEVKTIVQQRQLQRLILVTSGYHMRRAQSEFMAQLPGVAIVPHPVASDKHWGPMWWLTPWGWWLALSELVKNGLFMIGGSR